MTEHLAKYACDTCRARKIRCSRQRSGCQRCNDEGIACSYARSGVIRRNRRQREQRGQTIQPPKVRTSTLDTVRSNSQRPPPPSSDNTDGTTHERLQQLVGRDHQSLKAIASLLEEYAAAWQSSHDFDNLAEGAAAEYFSFEGEQVRIWIDTFIITLREENLLITSVPQEVLKHLLASRPEQVQDRAWLVIFYSVALGTLSSTQPSDDSTKAKLKSNLWLAFNNVKLLLEPSALSVQALLILACHVQEFMTPSMCWSLVSKACIMLQALGFTHWRLDTPTRERRTILFWRLNVLDNAMSLILCRPPTFHREITTSMPLPKLDQLLAPQSHCSSGRAPVLFEAHYMNQMHLMSCIMADLWQCLYGQDRGDGHALKETLDSWYSQATEVLEAAALAEKPVLGPSGAASVDLGLQTLRFHYYSLLVLLTMSCKQLRTQSTDPSRQMLSLLPSLADAMRTAKAPYTCLIWQRLHCPLVAFGALWGEIVIKRKTHLEQSKQFLGIVEHLPTYYGNLRPQHSLAPKLESITERIAQHARSILYSQDEVDPKAPESSLGNKRLPDLQRSGEENLGQHPTPPTTPFPPPPEHFVDDLGVANPHLQPEGLFTWPEDSFFDATFDWFSPSNFDSL